MTDPNEHITIPLSRYRDLVDADEKLARLEAAGVDNWDGYAEAMSGTDD